MKLLKFVFLCILVMNISSCVDEDLDDRKEDKELDTTNFKQGTTLPYEILSTLSDDTEIRNGGYGSAACKHPNNSSLFYALTDRGPNIKFTGTEGKGKKFPNPLYNPRIGLFKLHSNGEVTMEKAILLKNTNGGSITGLPNPEGKGSTGEVPYDMNGNQLSVGPNNNGTDNYGLDAEGLAAADDGTFWISDEYGPHIVHFDSNGVEIERISPKGINGEMGRKLPAVFAKRRPNRGMEGLTITPNQKTLVGIMQSTMYNPSKATKNSNVTRIVTFDIETGKTQQYLYAQEKNQNANSEITALSSNEFLVVERDTKYVGSFPEAQKHIYRVNLSNATNIGEQNGTDLFDDEAGYKIGDKTIEECTVEEIKAAGISFASKELVLDVVDRIGYKHDKLEGIWLINDHKIGLINDDDFAVTTKDGNLIQKILPGTDRVDASTLYIFEF